LGRMGLVGLVGEWGGCRIYINLIYDINLDQ
jgi:hypothetical protein